MDLIRGVLNRRALLRGGLALGTALWTVPGLLAEQLSKTPATTEGPFYPDKLPLDTDNDLLIINTGITPAVGEITHLSGRVLTSTGSPVANAVVEIWQCDANGAYLHSGTGNASKRDKNFQGFGRFLTNTKGEYYFRTIKPVPYPGRTPHIHVLVKKGERRLVTSQIFISGHRQNASDGVLRGVRNPIDRELLMADFVPLPESKVGELTAKFDIVVGVTPERP
jgi:protocatechuate 3,4-dioxygenase beta subunit